MSQIQKLYEMGVVFQISDKESLIAQFQVKADFIEKIKQNQNKDPSLVRIKHEVQEGQAPKFRIDDNVLKLENRLCVPDVNGLRQKIMQEAHYSPYTVHPGTTKMYHDVKDHYWWFGMKKDIAKFVSSCLTCQQVKFEHQKPTGLLQELSLPE